MAKSTKIDKGERKRLGPQGIAAVNAVYSDIDTVLNILRNTDMFGNGNLNLDVSVNPFEYILTVLERVKGAEWVYKVIGYVLTVGLEPLEEAIKLTLLANIKNLLSCSTDFFITDELLKEGIVLDLASLDVLRILALSPLSKTASEDRIDYNASLFGRFFYFDCDDVSKPTELKHSKDFNALLWYAKNGCNGERVTWRGRSRQKSAEPDSTLSEQEKKDGIVTLQYHGTTGIVEKDDGSPQYLQSPCMNCIHVFLGNTRPLKDDPESLDRLILENQNILGMFDDTVKKIDDACGKLRELIANADGNVSHTITSSIYQEEITELELIRGNIEDKTTALTVSELLPATPLPSTDNVWIQHNAIDGTVKIIVNYPTMEIVIGGKMASSSQSAIIRNSNIYEKMKNGYSPSHYSYRPTYYNYYHNKTLMQFNADYIYSMKLFDGKVVAAQLINAMTSCLNIYMSLSYEEQVVMEQVKNMVRDVVNGDDTTVSDCFFSFSNDQYNDMIERTTLGRLGISNEGSTGLPAVSPEILLEQLNAISDTSTKQELETAIEGILSTACTTEYGYSYGGGLSFDSNIKNLLDNLLNNLAYVIVCSIISPKFYMMIAINMKLLGQSPNFNIIEFINCFKQMIISLIRTVKDQLLNILMQELLKLVTELTEQVVSVMAKEQINYLRRFVQDCIRCYNMSRAQLKDWSPDAVDYADIDIDDIDEEQNTEQTDC